MSVKVFCCYSQNDELLLNDLKSHLKPLERQGVIEVWHDRDISAGLEWEHEISEHLNQAQIILLLVSPDFMNSDYCYSVELKRSIEKHALGEARVIPIIIRPVDWEDAPFSKLMALPTDGKPVLNSSRILRDEAWLEVVLGIKKVLKDFQVSLSTSTSKRQTQGQDALHVDKQHINILLIFANPASTQRLGLANEERSIRNVIRNSRYHDHIAITSLPAATYEDIQQALLEEAFQIAHFAGHATPETIILEDDAGDNIHAVKNEDFTNLLALYATSLQCVIFTSMYTLTLSQQLVKHIPFVITPVGTITDKECVAFSKGFYRAIGAGKPIEVAYQEGCITIVPLLPKEQRSAVKLLRTGDSPSPQKIDASES